jgi:hypothetical protein
MADERPDANDRDVPALRWEDVQDDWQPDGSELRDIYIFDTSMADWQDIRDLVDRRWPSTYSVDGTSKPLPATMEEVFEDRANAGVSWRIEPRNGLEIRCFFFAVEMIEFDLAPRDVADQLDLDAVCEFVRAAGQSLGKAVLVCYEGTPDYQTQNLEAAIMRYDPERDSIDRVPPPEPSPFSNGSAGRSGRALIVFAVVDDAPLARLSARRRHRDVHPARGRRAVH